MSIPIKRLFEANVYFKLNDSFRGTVVDALRQMADYLEKIPDINEKRLNDTTEEESPDERWSSFSQLPTTKVVGL